MPTRTRTREYPTRTGHGFALPVTMPTHIPVTITTIPITTIAATASTSKAPCANPFSPWDGDNMLPEVLKVQECTTGPWRRVWELSAITAWSRKGELTVLGSESPLKFLFYFVIIMALFY